MGNHSHIVAIKTTGNVFSYQAIKKLNFKYNIMRDLIDDEPFLKEHIIHIQNPQKCKKLFKKQILKMNFMKNKTTNPKKIKKQKNEKHKKKYYSNVHPTPAVSASF